MYDYIQYEYYKHCIPESIECECILLILLCGIRMDCSIYAEKKSLKVQYRILTLYWTTGVCV